MGPSELLEERALAKERHRMESEMAKAIPAANIGEDQVGGKDGRSLRLARGKHDDGIGVGVVK